MTKTTTPTEQLKGKDFEALIKQRCDQLRLAGLASIGRYGVQAARRKDDWVILRSLPDFEGVSRDGRQVVFDAKVCSAASFCLTEYMPKTNGAKSRQLSHMLERSRYNSRCFFLIHWNPRELQSRHDAPKTYAFPIKYGHPFWDSFDSGEVKAIRRLDCETYAQEIGWTLLNATDRKYRPDLMSAISSDVYTSLMKQIR